MKTSNLGTAAICVAALILLLSVQGCDSPTSSSGSDDPVIDTVARDLVDYDSSTGSLMTDPEPSLMFSVLPVMFTAMAIEDVEETQWGTAFEEFGAFLEDWIHGENGQEEWWKHTKNYSDENPDPHLITFTYTYDEGGISVNFAFDDELNLSALANAESPFTTSDGVEFVSGTIALNIDLSYEGEVVNENIDTGSGNLTVRIDIDNMRTEDGKTVLREAFLDLNASVSGNLVFADDEESHDEIGGSVSASLVAGTSLNLDEIPDAGLSDIHGKYVVRASFDKQVGLMPIENAFDQLFEALFDTAVTVRVCNNAGEVVREHGFTFADLEGLGGPDD